MSAKGILEVGTLNGEVIINHPDLEPDADGVGHIVFSPAQARSLAQVLLTQAHEAECEAMRAYEAERIASIPPTDFGARVLVSGAPVPEDDSHKELTATGQQRDYVVLSATERSKGFARPYRDAYRHLKCGKITTMSRAIAETYSREPHFYSGTFCTTCCAHFPIGEDGEFVWYEMNGETGP